MNAKAFWAAALSLVSLLGMTLACAANAANMRVNGVPKFVCPSAIPQPTSLPTYPSSFLANLDYAWVDPSRSMVQVQYVAQNVGTIQISYSGTHDDGTPWFGNITVGTVGNGPGFSGLYGVAIPTMVASASLSITTDRAGGYTFAVARYPSPVTGSPNPRPSSSFPAPIYPTPYPTPTAYSIPPYNNGFYFLDDPVYSFAPPIHLRLRLVSPINSQSWTFPWFGLTWSAATWTIQITNVGATEYDFLGAGYMYISEVKNRAGAAVSGVWSPSHQAAQFLDIIEQSYNPRAIMAGESITVTVAGWIPGGSTVSKVSFNLDPYNNGDPGWATFTPTQGRVAIWLNQKNTICTGEIRYP